MRLTGELCSKCALRFVRFKSSLPVQTTEVDIIRKQLRIVKKDLWANDGDVGWMDQLNKNFAYGRAHVTATNSRTDQKSVVRLSLPAVRRRYHIIRQSDLPEEAKEGLMSALKDCNQNPKVLQREADIMANYLDGRRFPATQEEVRTARRQVINEIMETDAEIHSALRNPRSARIIEKLIYKKAQEVLARQRFNWKPLEFSSRQKAAVFALASFPGYFAEMQRVLSEFHRNKFVPESVLDFGSGCGAAFWAAHQLWGDQIRHYCLVDKNPNMRDFSMDIMRGKNYSGSGEFVNKNVYFRKALLPSAQTKYDLVIVHRTLIEMPSLEERKDLMDQLWSRTNRYLVIVESPMYDSFKALMKVREYLLDSGHKFDYDFVKNILDERDLLNLELTNFLASKGISDYEKFCKVQELLGDDFVIPTKHQPAFVFAPCPNDLRCPKYSKDSCKFKIRWTENRADFKTRSPANDGTNTGWFCYVIFEKGERPKEETVARVLTKNKWHGCVGCQICTQKDGLQEFHVSKRTKDLYKRMKEVEPGQLLPLDYKVMRSGPRTMVTMGGLLEETVANDEHPVDKQLLEKLIEMPSIAQLIDEDVSEEDVETGIGQDGVEAGRERD